MRKIRKVLSMKFEEKRSNREIARSCSISPSTVNDYLLRAKTADLSWPLPEEMDDEQLERRLFPPADHLPATRPSPNLETVHEELKRKGVTLSLLWQEYKEEYPEGFQYSAFCRQYRAWTEKIDVSMRQEHRAGEKMFVDYAGQGIEVVDRRTGEVKEAQIFIAVLGASSYTFAEATWTQQLPDWIASHVRALEFFEGAPEVLVPDNLKSGVTSPCRYEPEINPTYQDMAEHYGMVVIPARVRKPKDKAKAEIGVQLAERWILARLRNQTYFSLAEVNRDIARLLEELNAAPFQKLPGSRRSWYETIDRPALKALPASEYRYAEWKRVRVHIDYHVEVDGHYYSVPYQLVKEELEVRMTSTTVECFFRRKRVASHIRSERKGSHTTLREHMPRSHQEYSEWTPERLIRWAGQTGPNTATLVETILGLRRHPQQGYRSCLGLLRLERSYGGQRLEAACQRALVLGACSYKSVKSILSTGMDRKQLPKEEDGSEEVKVTHGNIRGSSYYH